MKSKLLTLDIGVTTGIAMFTDGKLQLLDTIVLERLGSELPVIKEGFDPDYTLAERPIVIRGQLGKMLERAIQQTDYVFNGRKGFMWIDAPRWKNTQYKKAKLPWRGLTEHEKDAYRMGLWYLNELQGK